MRAFSILVIFSILATPAAALPEAFETCTTNAVASAGWDETTPYAKHVREAASASNVRAELLHALIHAESNYFAGARSPSGALGLMQLMPGIARRYNVRNPMDARQNILGGAKYVRDLLDLFENDMNLVLAAYNAGEHMVTKYGKRIPPFAETRAFVRKVTSLYEKLSRASAAHVSAAAPVCVNAHPAGGG